MKHKSKPTLSTSAASESASVSPAPTHHVQEHQGLCILALPASFRRGIPAERWDGICHELHAQVLELIERLPAPVHFVEMPLCVAQILGDVSLTQIGRLLTQGEFVLKPREQKGGSISRAPTLSKTSKKGASRA
jgi:hypothetical protein